MKPRQWALILGSSSGFGAATARAFAQQGYGILGIHLDRKQSLPKVEKLLVELRSHKVPVHFFNRNAANDTQRAELIADIQELLTACHGKIHVLLHSLAFGSLMPLIEFRGSSVRKRQLDMTIDVMANSLVYWTQELLNADLLENTRIFAMTSAGSASVWPSYGPVAAAKAALEAHVRQLAVELAPFKITVNAILAGVTDTPALQKIPRAKQLLDTSRQKNPHGRITKPQDVAQCLLALASTKTYWMTGNIICVDGGESICA